MSRWILLAALALALCAPGCRSPSRPTDATAAAEQDDDKADGTANFFGLMVEAVARVLAFGGG